MPLGGLLSLGGLIGGIGQAVGGVIGGIAAGAQRDAASKAAAAAFDQINQIGAPPDMAKQILLQKFQQAGVLTPEIEQNINQQFSNVAQIQENPALQNAQMQALQQMQQVSQTGMRPQDQAAYNQAKLDASQMAQAQRGQIMQQMQARGQGGSGAELAAALQGAQGGANQLASQEDQIAAAASQNALNAIGQTGQLAGQVRGQNFNVADTKAQAADQLNRFNIQNQLAQQQRNVSSQNQAQAANLSNLQNINNQNVNNANQATLLQRQGELQNWQNQMGLAQAKANSLLGQANYDNSQANQTAQQFQNIGGGLGSGFAAYAKQQQQQNLLDRLFPQQNANSSTQPQGQGPTVPGSDTGIGSWS